VKAKVIKMAFQLDYTQFTFPSSVLFLTLETWLYPYLMIRAITSTEITAKATIDPNMQLKVMS